MNRLAVVGLGLIGGSFAKGLRQSGLCREVVGCDPDPVTRKLAVSLGVVDRMAVDLPDAVQGADLILLAVPVLAMGSVLQQLAGLDLGRAVITDTGSTKTAVVEAVRQAYGQVPPRFVPGHPIAGSERSGVEAADAGLFSRHKVILTPLDNTDADALNLVRDAWRALGADVENMPLEDHDE